MTYVQHFEHFIIFGTPKEIVICQFIPCSIGSICSRELAAGRTASGHLLRNHWNHGTMEPLNHGTMEPWNHGTMEPWNGTMEPWNRGNPKKGKQTIKQTTNRQKYRQTQKCRESLQYSKSTDNHVLLLER